MGFGIIFTFVLPEKLKIVNIPEKGNETLNQHYCSIGEDSLSFRVNDSLENINLEDKDHLISLDNSQ